MGSNLREEKGGGRARRLHLVIEGNSSSVKIEKCNFTNIKFDVALFLLRYLTIPQWTRWT